ncbi:hypothetical protein DSO57_1000059 [Entomophthora muscae]|uniref:Uncharacterized protein n=1 Tax=Entomophthora muscae TaxID=34485 RepID=A0ACC2SM60_9FUNG|nr:hypothetical protein DSO57_1000059 [Entomophthora muscae]
MQTSPLLLEKIILYKLLRTAFVDSSLNFPTLHRMFRFVYAPTIEGHLYILDQSSSFELFVARAFFAARCRSLKLESRLDVSRQCITTLLIHGNAVVIKRAKSKTTSMNLALASLLRLSLQDNFIASKCSCKQKTTPTPIE